MKKLGIIVIAAVVIAGAAAVLVIHSRSKARLREGVARLREQSDQISALAAEQERLSKCAAEPTRGQTNGSAAEMAKLRGEIAALKRQTNDLAQEKTRGPKATQTASGNSTPVQRTQEYWKELRQTAGTRPVEVRDLGQAFGDYAFDHQNQAPTSLDQLSKYLADNKATMSGTNQYEIIFHGSLDQLRGLPWGSIAVVRDAQPWPGPDGTMMRTYGFPGGLSQMIIDGLQPWTSEHVILQTGQK